MSWEVAIILHLPRTRTHGGFTTMTAVARLGKLWRNGAIITPNLLIGEIGTVDHTFGHSPPNTQV